MKRALVTGATGFIGQHLVARLTAEGWSVVRMVRRTVDTDPKIPGCQTVQPVSARWGVEIFLKALEESSPDVVFHMAGTTRATSPVELYEVNVGLAAALLEAIEMRAEGRQSHPLVVLAGSAAEYGMVAPQGLPVSEDHPCVPVTDYGISKYAQTLAGLARARVGINVIVMRIFNPVGFGMPRHLALASFSEQIRQGAEVLQVGDLDVERDFIDVSEAARLITALAIQQRHGGRSSEIVYNICSGHGFRLRCLVEQLVKLCGRPVAIETDPSRVRAAEMRSFHGSIVRLVDAGLRPAVPDFAVLLPQLLADRKTPVAS